MLEQHTELFYGTNSRTSISIMRTTPQTRFAGQLVLQLWTRFARGLPARLSARTAPTNSSAVCLTVLS
ncbi:hypothetical protein BW14_09605 [Bifidobacterium sp. UTBIF-68]|nr:hypothetical protein BW14_09605 [Bifidobacterium sp. UTBIF-68]